MSSRSLNKVLLIGNLTHDPELRYPPQEHHNYFQLSTTSLVAAVSRSRTPQGNRVSSDCCLE